MKRIQILGLSEERTLDDGTIKVAIKIAADDDDDYRMFRKQIKKGGVPDMGIKRDSAQVQPPARAILSNLELLLEKALDEVRETMTNLCEVTLPPQLDEDPIDWKEETALTSPSAAHSDDDPYVVSGPPSGHPSDELSKTGGDKQ